MTNRLELNWKLDGFVGEQRYYCSEAPINVNNLPTPKAVLVGEASTYIDTAIEVGKTYYIMMSSFKNGIEKLSEQLEITTSSTIWDSTSKVINTLNSLSVGYHDKAASISTNNFGVSLSGASKWNGSVLGADGKIYCIPYESADVLIINPEEQTAIRSNMGASLSGASKWVGGVLASDGKIYCIPFNATDILIIDPTTQTATRSSMGVDLSGAGKWTGGILGPDGKIYCIPWNSTNILVINPETQTATLTSMGVSLSGGYKWNGGVLGTDGKIYGVPEDSANILIIDPATQTATRSNMGASLGDTDKYRGGVLPAHRWGLI